MRHGVLGDRMAAMGLSFEQGAGGGWVDDDDDWLKSDHMLVELRSHHIV